MQKSDWSRSVKSGILLHAPQYANHGTKRCKCLIFIIFIFFCPYIATHFITFLVPEV